MTTVFTRAQELNAEIIRKNDQRLLTETKERLQKLKDLNAPAIILRHEGRNISRLEGRLEKGFVSKLWIKPGTLDAELVHVEDLTNNWPRYALWAEGGVKYILEQGRGGGYTLQTR